MQIFLFIYLSIQFQYVQYAQRLVLFGLYLGPSLLQLFKTFKWIITSQTYNFNPRQKNFTAFPAGHKINDLYRSKFVYANISSQAKFSNALDTLFFFWVSSYLLYLYLTNMICKTFSWFYLYDILSSFQQIPMVHQKTLSFNLKDIKDRSSSLF